MGNGSRKLPLKMPVPRKEPSKGGSVSGKIIGIIGIFGVLRTLIGSGIYFIRVTNWFSVWDTSMEEALRVYLIIPLLLSLFVLIVGVDMFRNSKQ